MTTLTETATAHARLARVLGELYEISDELMHPEPGAAHTSDPELAADISNDLGDAALLLATPLEFLRTHGW